MTALSLEWVREAREFYSCLAKLEHDPPQVRANNERLAGLCTYYLAHASFSSEISYLPEDLPPEDIMKAARQLEYYFKLRGVDHWKLCGVESRDWGNP